MKPITTPNITALRRSWMSTSFLANIVPAVVHGCLTAGRCYEYRTGEMLIRERVGLEYRILGLACRFTCSFDHAAGDTRW